MKTLKCMLLSAAAAMLIMFSVSGSLGDQSANEQYLTIVQSELERSSLGLAKVAEDRNLYPVTSEKLSKNEVQISDTFSVMDKKNHTVEVELTISESLYTADNVLDHIVVVTNTGNVAGYIRTWFAFEMGDLTAEEFQTCVVCNQNTSRWTWGSFSYGVVIDGQRYAVVCADYNDALTAESTTAPSLLQIYLRRNVSGNVVNRLDGNHDGKYEVRAHSQVVSDSGAWSNVGSPWDIK